VTTGSDWKSPTTTVGSVSALALLVVSVEYSLCNSVTNGEGETSYFDYDVDDNLIGSSDGRSVDGDDETYQTSFSYDLVGNKTSETDPLGNTQTWDYTDGTQDAYPDGKAPVGLLWKYREQRGNVDPEHPVDSFATVYGYYGDGDLASVTTPSGFTTSYIYDQLGRVLTERFSDPVAGIYGQLVATYTYDPVGNVKTVTGPVVDNALSGSHQLKVSVCQAAISSLSVVAAARRSSVIIGRQRWMARRRFRQRMASLRVLPSAILLSKYEHPMLFGMRTWVTVIRWIAEFNCRSPLRDSRCRVRSPEATSIGATPV